MPFNDIIVKFNLVLSFTIIGYAVYNLSKKELELKHLFRAYGAIFLTVIWFQFSNRVLYDKPTWQIHFERGNPHLFQDKDDNE